MPQNQFARKPAHRKLRGYAFDPSLSLNIDTAVINNLTYKIDWEDVKPGPVGEYIEVVDYDPASNAFYSPIYLNDPYILATDGLEPSESNPQFHQQMVYAVAMTTIKNFELALGRKAIWNPQSLYKNDKLHVNYVQRLRIYPHALREANAYYSTEKKSLLFGYFSASPSDITKHMPGAVVFSCLSHDIIAHETTHALLDGMHNTYTKPTNPDVLAFHEAFADIVSLFQHFTFPEVLKHQIARTKGNLENQNILGQLAQEFGKAIGHYGALRDAIGENDEKGIWRLKVPDPKDYKNKMEPHERGSILVAAVFHVFLNIYKDRVSDLLRIATGGSGVLPDGEIQPDLVNRLANEAAKAAGHVLRMCIRALDYCPAVGLTFGEYLRAIITADIDLVADDSRDYRIAFIDAFRKWGIYPERIKTLSVESLVYKAEHVDIINEKFQALGSGLKQFREKIFYISNRKELFDRTRIFIKGGKIDNELITGIHQRIDISFDGIKEFEELTGLVFSKGWEKLGIRTSYNYFKYGAPSFSVRGLNVVNRVGPEGTIVNQIVLTLMQRCGVVVKKKKRVNDGDEEYAITPYVADDNKEPPKDGFEFQGACTLIFDLDSYKSKDSLELKYVISKPLIDVQLLKKTGKLQLNKERIIRQFQYMYEEMVASDYSLYFGDPVDNSLNEPFSFLHQSK